MMKKGKQIFERNDNLLTLLNVNEQISIFIIYIIM